MQPTRGGPPDLGLNDGLATPCRKKETMGGQIIWNDLTSGKRTYKLERGMDFGATDHWLYFAFIQYSRKKMGIESGCVSVIHTYKEKPLFH